MHSKGGNGDAAADADSILDGLYNGIVSALQVVVEVRSCYEPPFGVADVDWPAVRRHSSREVLPRQIVHRYQPARYPRPVEVLRQVNLDDSKRVVVEVVNRTRRARGLLLRWVKIQREQVFIPETPEPRGDVVLKLSELVTKYVPAESLP